jgi:hypothetical protein
VRRKRGSPHAELNLLTRVRVGPVGAAALIYASAAKVVASSETATATPTVVGNFMRGSFTAHARHGDSPQRFKLLEATVYAPPAQQTQRSDAADEIGNYLWSCIR